MNVCMVMMCSPTRSIWNLFTSCMRTGWSNVRPSLFLLLFWWVIIHIQACAYMLCVHALHIAHPACPGNQTDEMSPFHSLSWYQIVNYIICFKCRNIAHVSMQMWIWCSSFLLHKTDFMHHCVHPRCNCYVASLSRTISVSPIPNWLTLSQLQVCVKK